MKHTISMPSLFSVLMCQTSCSSSLPAVTHPTEPGSYSTGDWKYVHTVSGDNLKHRQGLLSYKSKQVVQPMGTFLDTPLGKFMSFDNLRGGQVGYNTGWLMTVFIHDTKRSNVVAPVFLSDGSVNPEVLQQLPIKKTDVNEIKIDQITKPSTATE